MTAVIITFRKSNKKSQEHHACVYVIGQVGKNKLYYFLHSFCCHLYFSACRSHTTCPLLAMSLVPLDKVIK